MVKATDFKFDKLFPGTVRTGALKNFEKGPWSVSVFGKNVHGKMVHGKKGHGKNVH